MVGGFHVAGCEVADVCFESCWRGAVFGGKGVPIGDEFIRVPLRGEDVGKGREGVRELKVIDEILSLDVDLWDIEQDGMPE